MILTASPEKFTVFAPEFVRTSKTVLTIDRQTFSLSCHTGGGGGYDGSGEGITKRTAIDGILGIVQLVSGPHLVVVTKKVKVGQLTADNHVVWKVAETAVMPFSRSELHLTPDELRLTRKQRSMVEDLLNGGRNHFYFSHTYDLTNSQQRLNSFLYGGSGSPLGGGGGGFPPATLNSTFAWNHHILRPFFAKVDFLAFCVVAINGAVFSHNCSIGGKHFRWSLISRRSTRRAGTRFYRRGCDASGSVANFVETEQVLEHGDKLASFLQTRGSMALFWDQRPCLKYMPEPRIRIDRDHTAAFNAHFKEQFQTYGKQVVINLVNQSKHEGRLEKHFSSLCINCPEAFSGADDRSSSPHLRYEAFDFHKECSNLRWDRLSLLVDRLQPEMDRFGFFLAESGNVGGGGVDAVVRKQAGVFRTNCMDCLDRTNVVQSMVASENLDSVLRLYGILDRTDSAAGYPEFRALYRNVWADHANLLSLQYTGSEALKTDFTRTGKRTVVGALEDLKNALIRYYCNNFVDGFRQDAIDLFLGTTKKTDVREMVAEPPKFVLYLPLMLLVDLCLLVLTYLLSGEIEPETCLFMISLAGFATFLGLLINRKAQDFVDRPRFS